MTSRQFGGWKQVTTAANVNLYHVNKFPIFLSFTVHYNYTEIISFMPPLSMRIALSRFYQLIFYFEKFSS